MKRKMMKSIMRAEKLEPGTSRLLILFESPDIYLEKLFGAFNKLKYLRVLGKVLIF